jgi:RNA polymerase sigma-70 factor (ECF subfamily)
VLVRCFPIRFPALVVSDDELLANINAGCADCFASLFRRFFRPVYAMAYKILRDRAEAEDLLQEVFLAIYLQQKRFDSSKGSVRTWILQFAYFKALLRRRYLGIRKFYKQEELREATEPLEWPHPAESFGLNQSEWLRFVERGVDSLTEKQRRTIKLVHVEGYTLKEAAEAQGETLANTRNCYYRGLKALRIFLGTNPEASEAGSEVGLLDTNAALGYDKQ